VLQENVYLVLGCYGRKEDGFTLCPSTENRILRIDDSLAYFEEIWSYLETIGLLDKPLININAVQNFVFRMQDRFDQKIKKLWSEQQFNTLERFIHMHKTCGLYVRLLVINEGDGAFILEGLERVEIRGTKIEEPESKYLNESNLVTIRSRR